MDPRRSDPLCLGGAGDALSVLSSSSDGDWLQFFCSPGSLEMFMEFTVIIFFLFVITMRLRYLS